MINRTNTYRTNNPQVQRSTQDMAARKAQGFREDYTELLAQFNQTPGALRGLLLNVEAMKEVINSLVMSNEDLEKAISAAQDKASDLEKMVQVLQSRNEVLHQSTIQRASKLEQSMAHLMGSGGKPTSETVERHQELWDLMWHAATIYTPKVLCHFLKEEEMLYTTTSDRLVFLANKHHQIQEIKRVYLPDPKLWISPKPMNPRLERDLRSQSQEEQEAKMNHYRTEIVNYFKDDQRGRIPLFEMEDKTLSLRTHQERINYLKSHIRAGQMAAQTLKKQKGLSGLMKMASFGKKH